MSLELAEKDKALLAGELGRAAKMAMSILVRMADMYRAERMLDITGAHVDSCDPQKRRSTRSSRP